MSKKGQHQGQGQGQGRGQHQGQGQGQYQHQGQGQGGMKNAKGKVNFQPIQLLMQPNDNLKTASEVIESHVLRIINSGDYVNSERVLNDLITIHPKVKHSPLFREIQKINKFVDSVVDVYWHSHSIRIYHELESLVVHLYNRWQKKDCISFLDIGVGHLCKCSSVVSKFELYEAVDLTSAPLVTRDDILSCVITYVRRGKKFDKIELRSVEQVKAFNKYLQSALQTMFHYRSKLVINVDISNLLHQIFAIVFAEQKVIRETKDNMCELLRGKCKLSIQKLLKANPGEQEIELSKHLASKLSSMFSSVDVFNTNAAVNTILSILPFKCYCPQGFKKQKLDFESILSKEKYLAEEYIFRNCDNEATVDDVFILSNVSKMKYFNQSIIVVSSFFIKNNMFPDSHEEIDFEMEKVEKETEEKVEKEEKEEKARVKVAKLHNFFRCRIFEDIPEVALIALLKYSKQCIKQNCLSIDGSELKGTDVTTKICYDTLLSNLEENLSYVTLYLDVDGGLCKKQPKNTSKRFHAVRRDYIMAAMVASIVTYRLHLVADSEDQVLEDVVLTKVSSILKDTRLESGEVCSEGKDIAVEKCKEILNSLSAIERLISQENAVPSFELLGRGTFVEFLNSVDGPDLFYSLISKYGMGMGKPVTEIDSLKISETESHHNPLEITDAIVGVVNDLLSNSWRNSNDIFDVMSDIEVEICASLRCDKFESFSDGVSLVKYLSNLRSRDDIADSVRSALISLSAYISDGLLSGLSVSEDHGSETTLLQHIADNQGHQSARNRQSTEFLNCDLLERVDNIGNLNDVESEQQHRRKLRKLLTSVPIGVSCAEFMLWVSVNKDHSLCPRNLLDFISEEQSFLSAERQDVSYIAVSDVDAVAVSSDLPSVDKITENIKSSSWSVIASWCLATSVGIFNKSSFCMHLRAALLIATEESGSDGTAVLFNICIQSTLSTATAVGGLVLICLMEVMVKILEIPSKTFQKHLIQHAVCRDKDLGISVGNCCSKSYLWLLMNASLHHWSDTGLADFINMGMGMYENLALSFHKNSNGMKSTTAMNEEISGVIVSGSVYPDGESNSVVMSSQCNSDIAGVVGEPEAVISNLLRSDFGFSETGTRPPEDSPVTVKLRNALEHLSTGLYASDVHFVSEIVQNSDDNEYRAGDIPTLLIQLYPHVVVIYNNEIGFSESNIIAICNVGGSTKKNRPGYIGQKGIGFKSVFTISDFPEVHSKGYHIGFDRTYMIEPVWLNESKTYKWPTKVPIENDNLYFETCLRLRLDAKNRKNLSKLSASLDDVYDENLLLFLNKLERMIYEDKFSDCSVELTRHVLANNWAKILTRRRNCNTTVEESDMFWFVKNDFFTPVTNRTASMNSSENQSKIAVAVKFLRESNSGQLKLTCKDNLPVYAFLPTKCTVFKFIVQGDFILSTSRESLLENHEWNQELMGRIPLIVVKMVCELTAFAWLILEPKVEGLHSCDHLDQIKDTNSLGINLKDAFGLLPLISSCPPGLFRQCVFDMYNLIVEKPFVLSRSKIPCKPTQLILTSHLPFDPSKYISEDLLLAATGYRYPHEKLIDCLDEERVKLLQFKHFDINTVVTCFEYVAASQFSEVNCPTMKMLSSLLVCLDLATANKFSRLPSSRIDMKSPGSKKITPVQVMTNNPPVTKLKSDIVNVLRKLCIWPSSDGGFVTLDTTVVYINPIGGRGNTFSPAQEHCLQVFKDDGHLPMLLEDIFLFAERLGKGFDDSLRKFLLRNFSGEKTSSAGGIVELTAERVIRTIILPAYESDENKNRLGSANGSSCEITDSSSFISRQTGASYLAFLYLSFGKELCGPGGSSAKLKGIKECLDATGLVVPVCVIAEGQKGSHCKWVSGNCRRLKKYSGDVPPHEIHLGVEYSKSISNQLTQLPIKTALHQLAWTIVDPLVATFVFDIEVEDGSLNHEEVCQWFKHVKEENIREWCAFLKSFGVVDFFGVYNEGTHSVNNMQAPHLVKTLNHLVRHSVQVCTRRKEVTGDCPSGSLNNPVSDESNEAVQLPVFLPSPITFRVRLVNKDIHNSLKKILTFVSSEIKQLPVAHRERLTARLSDLCWLPAETHNSLSLALGDKFIISSPRNVFVSTEECQNRDFWGMKMGAHCLYLPQNCSVQDVEFLGVQRYSEDRPHCSLCVGILRWMSETSSYCDHLASVAFMTRLYNTIFNQISNSGFDIERKEMVKLLTTDGPVIWFPNDVEGGSSQFSSGKMWKLSSVIVKDPSLKFINVKDVKDFPVKVLSDYYYDSSIALLFSRKRLCNACRAKEGMFGARGAPTTAKEIYSQTCNCIEEGFGNFVPDMPGLLRTSPALADMISLLRHYISLHVPTDGSEKEKIISSRNERVREDIKSVMISVSKEVWKCFNSHNCLHPYSPKDLCTAKAIFQNEQLLLTMDGIIVSSQDLRHSLLVVDDRSIFDCFRDLLCCDNLQLLDGCISTIAAVEEDFSAGPICLDELAASRQRFLELPPTEFSCYVGNIPPETFFAPNNMLYLMKFLEIPLLSHFVTETTNFSCKTFDGTNTADMFNKLFMLTLMFLRKLEKSNLVDQLPAAARVKALLDLNICGSRSLNYSVSICIPHLDINASKDNVQRSFYLDISTQTLFIEHDCPYNTRRSLCIDLIMRAIRVEVALLEKNQCLEMMKDLNDLLKKYSQSPERMIEDAMFYEKFEAPPDKLVKKWQLHEQEVDAGIPDAPVVETTIVSDAANGFDSLKARVKGKRQNVDRTPTAERNNITNSTDLKTDNPSREAYLIAQAEKEKELKDALHADVAVCDIIEDTANYLSETRDEGDKIFLLAESSNKMPLSCPPDLAKEYIMVHRENNCVGREKNNEYVGTKDDRDERVKSGYIKPEEFVQQDKKVSSGISNGERAHSNRIATSQNAQSKSMVTVTLSEDDLCDISSKFQIYDSTKHDCEAHVQSLHLSENLDSGRIGEALAVRILEKFFTGEQVTIKWLNESREQGHPYDISIQYESNRIQYCEVKSHIARAPDTPLSSHQWFISPREVLTAGNKETDYFCCFISAVVDEQTDESGITVHSPKYCSSHIVGYEDGLMSALQDKQVSLIVQLN